MAYINGKEILFNPQVTEVVNGLPAEVSTEAEMDALLIACNVGKVYRFKRSPIAVGDTLTELYFDTDWKPYVHSAFGIDALIKTGETKTAIIQNGERAEFTTQLGLVATNDDDPQQYELVWRTCKYENIVLEQLTEDTVRVVVDGQLYYEGNIDDSGSLDDIIVDTVVYRDYEEFWEGNGKPVYWLTDKLVFDRPVKVTGLHHRDAWGEYITKAPKSSKYKDDALYIITEEDGSIVAREQLTPSGSLSITENGTYDVTEKESVEVNIESGGGDLDAFIDGTLTELESNATSVKSCAFYKDTSLKSVSFPQATSIGANAFTQSILTSASFPQATSIGASAFLQCSSLKRLDAKLTTIGKQALDRCTALEEVDFSLLETLQYGGLSECTSLPANLSFPKLKTVEGNIFNKCTSIESVSCPLLEKLSVSYEFSGCTSLKSVDLPLVNTIWTQTFSGCTALETLSLPKLTKIGGQGVFQNCSSLKSIDMPLLEGALGQTSKIFYGCSALESISLPKVTSIPQQSFYNCSKLSQIIVGTEIDTVCSLANVNVFTNTPIASGTGYIYVPDGLVDSYKTATNWSTYANQIKGISELSA